MEPDITVSTVVKTHEDIFLVEGSVKSLFPDWDCEITAGKKNSPISREASELSGKSKSLSLVIENCSKNRILDTAFDAMTMNLQDDYTHFQLSRQAAFVGKVAFVVDEIPLGGVMEVSLQGEGLGLWIEQLTWHEGRHNVPRSLGDDLRMEQDGTPSEWFDNKGRRTMNSHHE
ncbi:MAG: hypothetical protein VYB30_01170 [Candidatus Thermoplasmatota archaeon]|nr:hypothetical protein [Candidatus Thermoplasmatota archaeon]